ncbi:MAG: hypothetical protein QXW47_06570 [Candidatus Jordarchaeales archaeon]
MREIQDIAERDGLNKATVVRLLLKLGITEWRKKTALELLREGKVTFTKVAEIAKIPLGVFRPCEATQR